MINWFEKHNKISFLIFLIILMAIFYLSSQQSDPSPKIKIPLKATIYHLSVFFFLSFFLMIATSKGKDKDWIFFSFLFSILYAFSDELHQFFVPGRISSLQDVFLDVVGISFAFLIYLIRYEVKNGNQNKSLQLLK